ncbi:hypothetical protein JQN58_08300 [Aneurinibacillus sp. BA2021]|nr:hypothetical protein [Aneurinibacillus sp. BA2021]
MGTGRILNSDVLYKEQKTPDRRRKRVRQTRKARLRRKRRQQRIRRVVSLLSLLSLSISQYASPAVAYFSDQKAADVQFTAAIVFEKTLHGLQKETTRSRLEAQRLAALAEERLQLCENAPGAAEAFAIKTSSIDVALLSVLQQEQLMEAIVQELARYEEEAKQQAAVVQKALAAAQRDYSGPDAQRDETIRKLQESLDYVVQIQADIEKVQRAAEEAAAAIGKNIRSIQQLSARAGMVVEQKEQAMLPAAPTIQPVPNGGGAAPSSGEGTGAPSSGGGGSAAGGGGTSGVSPSEGGGSPSGGGAPSAGGSNPAPAPDHGSSTAPETTVPSAPDAGKPDEGSTPATESTSPDKSSDSAAPKEETKTDSTPSDSAGGESSGGDGGDSNRNAGSNDTGSGGDSAASA